MAQPIKRRIQCFVFFGEVQADDVVDRLAEEGTSRHRTDADLACELLAEVNIALPLFEVRRNIGQYEVCAFGIGEGNADITHAIGEDLLHVCIVRAEFIVVA